MYRTVKRCKLQRNRLYITDGLFDEMASVFRGPDGLCIQRALGGLGGKLDESKNLSG